MLTWVDEKLIGQSGVVDVMYGGCEKGRGDFQRRKHALKRGQLLISDGRPHAEHVINRVRDLYIKTIYILQSIIYQIWNV